MKPVVGVTPLWDDEKQSIWMLPGYLGGIRQAGGVPLLLPLCAAEEELQQLAGLCDGFLFTGGQDVDPRLYHEEPLEGLVSCCPARDALELPLLRGALAAGKPLLGICRGLQLINAALGGSLYQDLPSQRPSDTAHSQRPPYHRPAHPATLIEGTPLHRLLGAGSLQVNSLHHQGVKALAPGLQAMATAPDGLVEAFWAPDHPFLWAVQWHPEYLYETDPASRGIFSAFVAAMAAGRG